MSQIYFIVYFVSVSCITLVRVHAVCSELSKKLHCYYEIAMTKYVITYTFLFYSFSIFYALTMPVLDHNCIFEKLSKKYKRRRLTYLPLTNTQKFILMYVQQDATLHSLFYLETALMFRVVPPPMIRSANNSIYSIWYLSRCSCYLPLSWKSWNWFECAVGGVR